MLRTALLRLVVGLPKRLAVSQFSQSTLFDLSYALVADAKHRGKLLVRVGAFVRNDESAVTSRGQAMLAISAVLEVIAAMRLRTPGVQARARAALHRREACRD